MYFFFWRTLPAADALQRAAPKAPREVPPKVMDDRPKQGGYFPTCEQKFAKFED